MLIDLTVLISALDMGAFDKEKMASFGHLGTHFDVMNKEFPLSYIKRDGLIFDVSDVQERDIDIKDIDISLVKENMFVAFHSGFIENVRYGTTEYFTNHPQLSDKLIDKLLEKKISIIGVDFAGVRRGKEHTPKDQYCADRGLFIVENLCNLKELLGNTPNTMFQAHTFPIKFADMSGLPCRVVAEV
jgi:kynurenine formamidase